MALYHTITDTVLDPPARLPTDCPLRADVLANFTDAAPIAQWARGFCRGHRWLDALWEATVPQALDEEFGSVVMTLIFFSSRAMAEAFHREAAREGQSFARTATGIHRVLPCGGRPVRAPGSIGRRRACRARRRGCQSRAWGDGRRPRLLSVWQRQDVHELLQSHRPLSARRIMPRVFHGEALAWPDAERLHGVGRHQACLRSGWFVHVGDDRRREALTTESRRSRWRGMQTGSGQGRVGPCVDRRIGRRPAGPA